MYAQSLPVKTIHLGIDPDALAADGFQFLQGNQWPVPASVARYWPGLVMSWEDLPQDAYMRDGASYRQRRFGRFIYDEANGSLHPLRDTTFFQSKAVNSYVGGISRTFSPLHDLIYHNKFLHYVIGAALDHFRTAFGTHARKWDVSLHQFRIRADGAMPGQPTPEGIHRDGHKFVSMHMIKRHNVSGGISELYDGNKAFIAEFLLTQPMDTLFVADEVVMHAVSPIQARDGEQPAHRDMLVIDYNALEG